MLIIYHLSRINTILCRLIVVENFGVDVLNGKIVSVIGKPTLKTLNEFGAECETILADKATIMETCAKLAERFLNEVLQGLHT